MAQKEHFKPIVYSWICCFWKEKHCSNMQGIKRFPAFFPSFPFFSLGQSVYVSVHVHTWVPSKWGPRACAHEYRPKTDNFKHCLALLIFCHLEYNSLMSWCTNTTIVCRTEVWIAQLHVAVSSIMKLILEGQSPWNHAKVMLESFNPRQTKVHEILLESLKHKVESMKSCQSHVGVHGTATNCGLSKIHAIHSRPEAFSGLKKCRYFLTPSLKR